MKIIEWDLLKREKESIDATLVVGVFDAFHKGHQRIVQEAFYQSHAQKVVVTFRQLPPSKGSALYTFEQRLEDLKFCGFDEIVVVDFNEKFSALTAVEFFQQLQLRYKIQRLTVGSDFRCGRERLTEAKELEHLLPGIEVKSIALETFEDEKLASREIKRLISLGELKKANGLLIRAYRLPLKVSRKRFGIRHRKKLVCLPNGQYQTLIDGKTKIIWIFYSFWFLLGKKLAKKPKEIVILSENKE